MPFDWLSRQRLLTSVLGMYGLLLPLHGLPFGLMGKLPFGLMGKLPFALMGKFLGSAFASRKRRAGRLLCWADSTHCLPFRDWNTVGHLLQRQH